MSDADRQLDTAIEDAAAETLSGDLRDAILNRIRGMQKPWEQLASWEQTNLNLEVERAVKDMIRKAMRSFAAAGRTVLVGKLDSITVKEGFKAVVKLPSNDPNRHELVDAEGKDVLIVVADATDYMGEKAPAEVSADQQPLPLDDDGPVADRTDAAGGGDGSFAAATSGKRKANGSAHATA